MKEVRTVVGVGMLAACGSFGVMPLVVVHRAKACICSHKTPKASGFMVMVVVGVGCKNAFCSGSAAGPAVHRRLKFTAPAIFLTVVTNAFSLSFSTTTMLVPSGAFSVVGTGGYATNGFQLFRWHLENSVRVIDGLTSASGKKKMYWRKCLELRADGAQVWQMAHAHDRMFSL